MSGNFSLALSSQDNLRIYIDKGNETCAYCQRPYL